MQIHELNPYTAELNDSAKLAVDNGTDTGKISATDLLAGPNNHIDDVESELNARIDNIIAGGTAPSAAEVTDARLGAAALGSKSYPSLGAAIRGQATELKDELDSIADYVNYDFSSVDYDDLLLYGVRTVVPCSVKVGDQIKIEYSDVSSSRTLTVGLCETGDTISQRLMDNQTISADGSVTVESTIDAVNYVLYTPSNSTQLKITRLAREGFSLKGIKIINAAQHGVVEGQHIYTPMNNILDKIGPEGAVIYLPAGTYTCNGMIPWKSNVSLIGDGIGQTIIKSVYGTVFGGSNLDNITFRDFTIDGADNAADNYGKGIFFTYLTNATFENLEIKNTKESGLGCDFFINGVIHNVRCDNCGWGGDLNNTAYGCSGIGIGVGRFYRGMEALSVSDCHADNCKQYGIFFERQFMSGTASDFPVGVSVVGCTAEGNRAGFGISGCDNIVFVACTAYANHAAGFSFDKGTMGGSNVYGKRPKFIGCVSKGNGKNLPLNYPLFYGNANGHGFIALDNLEGFELTSCSSEENIENGVFVVNGIKDFEIIGGSFSRNSKDGIKCSGTLERFRISPSFVIDNMGVGVEFTGSVDRGSLKDAIITGNQIGVKSVNALTNTIVKDNQSYNNRALTLQLTDVFTGMDINDPVSIPSGTTLRIFIHFNDMNASNNFTLALMKNSVVVQKPFDGFIPSQADNERVVVTADDIDSIKIVGVGGTVNIRVYSAGIETNWQNVTPE